jgi:hypothetical protein
MASSAQVRVEGFASAAQKPLERLRKWIEDVPDEMAVCEFRCHEDHCHQVNWQSCAKRLHGC